MLESHIHITLTGNGFLQYIHGTTFQTGKCLPSVHRSNFFKIIMKMIDFSIKQNIRLSLLAQKEFVIWSKKFRVVILSDHVKICSLNCMI